MRQAVLGCMGAAPRNPWFLSSFILVFFGSCVLQFLSSLILNAPSSARMHGYIAAPRDLRFLSSFILVFFGSCVLRFLSSLILNAPNSARMHGVQRPEIFGSCVLPFLMRPTVLGCTGRSQLRRVPEHSIRTNASEELVQVD